MLTPMHQREALGRRCQGHRPVERRITPAKDDQPPPGQLLGVTDPVLDLIALEGLGAGHTQTPRLEGAKARRDDHRTHRHFRSGGGAHLEVSCPSGKTVVTSSPK